MIRATFQRKGKDAFALYFASKEDFKAFVDFEEELIRAVQKKTIQNIMEEMKKP